MPVPASSESKLSDPLRGILWMLASCVCYVSVTALVRHVGSQVHPFEVGFFRNLFMLLLMLPLMARNRGRDLRTRRPGLHLLRNLFGAATVVLWFTAFSRMPVADATALGFTTPLFGIVGAALVLGEIVRLRRWSAAAIAFLGVLIILRPGIIALTLPAVLMVAGSATAAAAMLTTKVLSRTDAPNTIVLYMGLMMTPMVLVPAVFVWSIPSWESLAWMGAVGLMATLGNMAQVRAFAAAEASVVLSVDFSKLIFATAIGYAIFLELPDVWTWVGALVILSANLYIAHREAHLARLQASGRTPPSRDCGRGDP